MVRLELEVTRAVHLLLQSFPELLASFAWGCSLWVGIHGRRLCDI